MKNFQDQFLLNPAITFLNFGSFGATPKPIFENYQHWQRVLESEPVQFIAFDGINYLAASREALAKYIGCVDRDDLVYVTNPSFAVNLIAKNFPLKAGDEILTTDIEYGACDRTWNFYCEKAGAKYRRQKINLPITTKEQFIADFFQGVTAKTKAIFISQITSSTGLIIPVKEVCEIAKSKGLITIVDGAHSFGLLDFKVPELGCDYFGTSLHKFLSAPIGSGMLWIKKENIEKIWPLVCNDNPKGTDIRKFETLGTRSFPIEQGIGEAINFHTAIGSKRKEERIRYLKNYWASRVKEIPKVKINTSLKDAFSCAICGVSVDGMTPGELDSALFTNYKIHTVGIVWDNLSCVRITPHVYTRIQDLDKLVNAIESIAKKSPASK